jgi:S-layer homology domain
MTVLLRYVPLSVAMIVLLGFAPTTTEAAVNREPTIFARAPFTDVAPTATYYKAVEFFRRLNVIKGTTDGRFRPDDFLTRAEFAAIMTNRLFLHSRDESCVQRRLNTGARVIYFPDVTVDTLNAVDICIARERQLVIGYPDGRFYPERPVSFVEAAKVICRVFALKVRSQSLRDREWYVPYIELFEQLQAVPSTVNVQSTRSLTRPLRRSEFVEMLFRSLQVPAADATQRY